MAGAFNTANDGATLPMMADSEALHSRRYRDLVDQLREKYETAHPGSTRGWRVHVAKQLGVHPSYITKIEQGVARAVSPATVELAVHRLGIKPSFFTERPGETLRHDEYLGQSLFSFVPESDVVALRRTLEENVWTEIEVQARTVRARLAVDDNIEAGAHESWTLARMVRELAFVDLALRIGRPRGAEGITPGMLLDFARDMTRIAVAMRRELAQGGPDQPREEPAPQPGTNRRPRRP